MRKLADIPEHIKMTFTSDVIKAIELLEPDAKTIYAFFQYETGDFDGIGFIENGKLTKPANIDKYNAILVLEDRVRKELRGEATMSYLGGF